ncbi:ferritin-like domain-containing protein [Actinokineospora auranticolor]|uniref:Uncharacterized protein DUF4439 n=1 Tax=Actinokineospora auranticolor TaxID=155976 RepID=A0A2S6GQ81_9PSEU|nr:ferritin-like domain-containing protein [Actinokineospora auranticolor]PPK67422.1 uncharacterized protein DUF4439 [Actinokineospora auranticolor]
MTQPSSAVPPSRAPLPEDTLAAVQAALGAEHAAVWVYGLVSAFLPATFDKAIAEGATAHRACRDTTGRLLGAAGATPEPAEPAYLPPKPVTDQASALELVVNAETDTTTAWRAAMERTDAPDVRRIALDALKSSAARSTRWRKTAGLTPLTPPLPGQP